MRDHPFHKAKSPQAAGSPALGAFMPESLADRFMLCPVCREDYDMRDLGAVLRHLHASEDESDAD